MHLIALKIIIKEYPVNTEYSKDIINPNIQRLNKSKYIPSTSSIAAIIITR